MSGLTEFIGGEFERQLTIEQNKTNILNKELNDRLINENLSAEQRKDIQKQIAQNDENLRVKQDAINKKKFKQTKDSLELFKDDELHHKPGQSTNKGIVLPS